MNKDINYNIVRFKHLILDIGKVIKLLHKQKYEKAIDKLRFIQALCKFALDIENDKKRGNNK